MLLAAACTRNAPVASHSPTPSPSPGKIAWTACGGGFQCGTLQVPLDYSNPQGRTISLALIRKPATGPVNAVSSSLLINPGGPGESGVEFLRGDAGALTNLNKHFNLVAWDPRGVAG